MFLCSGAKGGAELPGGAGDWEEQAGGLPVVPQGTPTHCHLSGLGH